ncbi:MAG TPA: metalloregulator ArsR/SmtB family transcription factor [Syntrophorhabdaceae bacterium]|nr:metalloregulator ArsR/SmtB family transcription factor [Syntrophorhabdaceae bacterium]HPU30607.1 metalloregulator ArsR/SmtB family transcription factor [Syntrophorhabdaceae bacterium]
MIDEKAIKILSRLFKLINDPNRLKIIFTIGKEKKTVSEIIQKTGLSQTLVSFHLKPLRESGILSTERKGAFIYYNVTEPGLIDLLASLGGVKLKEGIKGEEQKFICPPMAFMRQWMGEKNKDREV